MATIKWTKKFYREVFIAVVIVISPFVLFLHVFFESGVSVFDFYLFQFRHGFDGNDTFVWYLLKKLIPITLLLIWFNTSRLRWRVFILIPSLPFIFSLVSYFFVGFDHAESFWSHFYLPDTLSIAVLGVLILFANYFKSNQHTLYNLKKQFFVNKKALVMLFQKVNLSTHKLENQKNNFDSKKYLSKLYYEKQRITDNLIEKLLTSPSPKPELTVIDVLFCLLLVAVPIVFYGYKLIAEGITECNFFIFTISKMGFLDVRTLIWYVSQSVCLLLPLSIWFLTEKSWWRLSILSPIILAIYHIWEAFGSNATSVDEVEYLKATPFVISLVVLLILLSYIVRMKYKLLDVYEWLGMEIDMLLSITGSKSVTVFKLKSVKEAYDSGEEVRNEEYYRHLLSIREQILDEIKAKSKDIEREDKRLLS